MESFDYFLNGIETHEYILDKIKKAKNVIYISSWKVNLGYILDKQLNEPLYKTLLKKCDEGVKVYILTSVTPLSETYNINMNILKTKKLNHKNFNIKILDMLDDEDDMFWIFRKIQSKMLAVKKCCKRLFHQRYFNVDNKYCLIGGSDLDDTNNCYLYKKKNDKKYYWIEYAFIFKPVKEFLEYCVRNFKSGGKSSILSNYFYGNFFYTNTEYNKLISLIRNAQNSIFIENQWIYSTKITKNVIIKEILDRIIQNRSITVTIITNDEYIDSCNKKAIGTMYGYLNCLGYREIFRAYLYYSLSFMFNYLRKHKLTTKEINKILKIYVPKKDVLIHSKNIIIDHNKMLYGTSNLWDRSYTKGLDIELSIFLKGNKVREVENSIIKRYLNGDETLDKTDNLKRIYMNKKITYLRTGTKIFIFIIILVVLILLYKYYGKDILKVMRKIKRRF
jgi:phosphatidylserine/phosphatidylglycerophosphate/cardiolipin synthase-like enzyme